MGIHSSSFQFKSSPAWRRTVQVVSRLEAHSQVVSRLEAHSQVVFRGAQVLVTKPSSTWRRTSSIQLAILSCLSRRQNSSRTPSEGVCFNNNHWDIPGRVAYSAPVISEAHKLAVVPGRYTKYGFQSFPCKLHIDTTACQRGVFCRA